MMKLVPADDPILHRACRRDFNISLADINEMRALLWHLRGLGLAAPQVGIDARLFITCWGQLFVAPRIVQWTEPVRVQEGCLSLPGEIVEVERSRRIALADGTQYHDQRSFIIQHENDHLHGRLITDRRINPSPKGSHETSHETPCLAPRAAAAGLMRQTGAPSSH